MAERRLGQGSVVPDYGHIGETQLEQFDSIAQSIVDNVPGNTRTYEEIYQALIDEYRKDVTRRRQQPNSPIGGTTGRNPRTSAGARPSTDNNSYEAFKTAFRTSNGRDITQDELNSNEFLASLSNELFRLLPGGRQVGFDAKRLSLLDNSDLIKIINHNPQILGSFSADRLSTFSIDEINRFIGYVDGSQLANDLRDVVTRAGGTPPTRGTGQSPPAGGTGPSTNLPSGGVIPGIPFTPSLRTGSAQDILGQGLQTGSLSDLDINNYFPFVTDPQYAARNIARGFGFNTDIGNPFVDFLTGMIPNLVSRTRFQNILGGRPGLDTQTLKDLPGVLRTGTTGLGGSDFVTGLRELQRKDSVNPETLNAEQRGLGARLTDNEEAFNFYMLGQDISPDLNTPELRRAIRNSTLDRYRNLAGSSPGKSYLDFLAGRF